jgi:hypothetical protein
MSGLIGYLTTSGSDLSSVFMPIANNRFNNGLVVNSNITLPTSYTAIPTPAQLGGKLTFSVTAPQSLSTGAVASFANITLPAGGVYFMEFLISYTQATSGKLTRFRAGISTVNNAFNIAENSQYLVGITSTNNNFRFIASCMHATTTASQVIHGVHSFVFTGTANATGSISYTRIA